MAQAADITTVRQTVARDLGKEIPGNGMVKVAETSLLATDLQEYVLTSQLAADYARVLERVVEAARPATAPADRVGIWISGFFGSGKSHFAKLAGDLLCELRDARRLHSRPLRQASPHRSAAGPAGRRAPPGGADIPAWGTRGALRHRQRPRGQR